MDIPTAAESREVTNEARVNSLNFILGSIVKVINQKTSEGLWDGAVHIGKNGERVAPEILRILSSVGYNAKFTPSGGDQRDSWDGKITFNWSE